MKRKKRIEKILSNNFRYCSIKVNDISNEHKGHNDFTGREETHFSICLFFQEKITLSKLDIHRKIYLLLATEFSTGLHALEIKIKN